MGLMTLDPVAELMLDEAGPLPEYVVVLDDHGGALTRAALTQGGTVMTWCDDLRDTLEVPESSRVNGPAPAHCSPDLVLWRLPKGVAAVEDYAEYLAGWVGPQTRIIAGGRTKHMTPTQTSVLERHFTDVSASLGRQKSRVLRAQGPRHLPRRWPMRRYLPEVGLTVVAHGLVFNTNRLDDGTRLLVRTMGRLIGHSDPSSGTAGQGAPARGAAIDLGCGSGIIASWLARHGYVTTAIDVSLAAVRSARLTAEANNLRIGVRRRDGLTGVPPGSVDLIALNPPFHRGSAKDSSAALAMIRQAADVLKPGGELWVVFNSHLPYLPEMRRIGITTVEARDRHYIVARSLKEAHA